MRLFYKEKWSFSSQKSEHVYVEGDMTNNETLRAFVDCEKLPNGGNVSEVQLISDGMSCIILNAYLQQKDRDTDCINLRRQGRRDGFHPLSTSLAQPQLKT